MKTSIEVVVNKDNNTIHFATTNVEIDDSPMANKDLGDLIKAKGFLSAVNYFKSLVTDYNKDEPANKVTNIYLHGNILEIDFKPTSIKDFKIPADKKPEYEGSDYRQYVFNEGELKDLSPELVKEAKEVRDNFIKWFNEYTGDKKVKVKEDIDNDLNIEFNVKFIPNEKKIKISTKDGKIIERKLLSDDITNDVLVIIADYLDEITGAISLDNDNDSMEDLNNKLKMISKNI